MIGYRAASHVAAPTARTGLLIAALAGLLALFLIPGCAKPNGDQVVKNVVKVYQPHAGWASVTEEHQREAVAFAWEYAAFINGAKTVRETVAFTEQILTEFGFVPIDEVETLKEGDQVFSVIQARPSWRRASGRAP